MVKILVCIKQVPAACEVGVSGTDFTLNRSGTEMICNPADERAFETALCLRDQLREGIRAADVRNSFCGSMPRDQAAAEVTLLSMGKPGAARMLRELSAIGGDRFYLISDPSYAGSDTYATAEILRRAVIFLGDFDLILCGDRAADGETGQVGPELAALLFRPFAGYAAELKMNGQGDLSSLFVRDRSGVAAEYLLPAVVSVSRSHVLRSPGIMGLRKAEKTEITALSAKELGERQESLTRVLKMTKEEVRRRRAVRFPPDESGIGDLIQAAELRTFL